MNKKRTRELKSIDNLLSIMDDLREACPWDRKQTFDPIAEFKKFTASLLTPTIKSATARRPNITTRIK